jgi:hypothetical protein
MRKISSTAHTECVEYFITRKAMKDMHKYRGCERKKPEACLTIAVGDAVVPWAGIYLGGVKHGKGP